MPALTNVARVVGAGVRKPPRKEPAGRLGLWVRRLYGDLGIRDGVRRALARSCEWIEVLASTSDALWSAPDPSDGGDPSSFRYVCMAFERAASSPVKDPR